MRFVCAALVCWTVTAAAAETLDYAALVDRMTDLARLAELPAAGERCAQWSSYERSSRYDAASGAYVRWDANNDGPNFIRTEDGKQVMAEMEGPGCLWRIWSADAKAGRVRIYLDGAATPAVDLPFADYFDGKHEPFAYPALSYDLREVKSAGQNLYFPIPYQKSCKVVADPDWGRYFHFTYTTYPAGTRLPTFSAALAAAHREPLARVDRFFRQQLGTDPGGMRDGERTERLDVALGPRQTSRLTLSGARAITALRVKASFDDRLDEQAALRQMLLRITWDDAAAPAVWSPLGDFFGTAPGENRYASLVTGMNDDGYYAYWYMPFAEKAVVEIVNDGPVERRLEWQVVHAPLGRPFDGLGHFFARWHRDVGQLPADRWPDWTMLEAQGRGRFCGVMLHVWNPRGGWWGEGDEKFFVDGEKFPSTIGTGSEDYFGYAWCNPRLFQRPYHAQTMTENNRGHQSVLRWHVVDNVPFQTSFAAAIEKYYTNEAKGTLYACLPVWYMAPGGNHPYRPIPLADRDDYYVVPELVVGDFKVANFPRGEVRMQRMAHYKSGKWSGDEQVWWTGARPGDRLELVLPPTAAGVFDVVAALTKARDYAIVQFQLDGKDLGPPIDLFNPQVVPTGPIVVGRRALSAGEHRLAIKIVGANPQALPQYMVGIDDLWLKPPPR